MEVIIFPKTLLSMVVEAVTIFYKHVGSLAQLAGDQSLFPGCSEEALLLCMAETSVSLGHSERARD